MGFFASQRIKNGTKASTREDNVSMPKNRLNMNVKPQTMEGTGGVDVQPQKPFDMDKAQQANSKRSPR